MQGTWVWALVREDPTCCGANKQPKINKFKKKMRKLDFPFPPPICIFVLLYYFLISSSYICILFCNHNFHNPELFLLIDLFVNQIKASWVLYYLSSFILSYTVTTSHMWLLNTWNVASVTKELNFKFYLILIKLI